MRTEGSPHAEDHLRTTSLLVARLIEERDLAEARVARLEGELEALRPQHAHSCYQTVMAGDALERKVAQLEGALRELVVARALSPVQARRPMWGSYATAKWDAAHPTTPEESTDEN